MWQFLKDLESEIPFDPPIALLVIYPKDYKPSYCKDTFIPTYVYWSTIHNSKDLEPTQMLINDRLDKENVAHIYHGILGSHKKDKFMSFAGTWMKLETIIVSKVNTGTENQTPHVLTHK